MDKAEHQRKRKVLASAYAIKNLEGWEHKIADKMLRLVRQFDARCVGATSKDGHSLAGEVVDYRAWTNFFTMDAILDIGLSQPAGFLDRGYDNIPSEEMDGTTKTVSYREVLHSNLTAQSHLVWAYDWYHMLKKWSRFLSSKYRTLLGKGDAFDGIVIHQMRRRFQRYQAGEKVVDFFQALMENRDGTPHMLEWGEIFAELNIMRTYLLNIDSCGICH